MHRTGEATGAPLQKCLRVLKELCCPTLDSGREGSELYPDSKANTFWETSVERH